MPSDATGTQHNGTMPTASASRSTRQRGRHTHTRRHRRTRHNRVPPTCRRRVCACERGWTKCDGDAFVVRKHSTHGTHMRHTHTLTHTFVADRATRGSERGRGEMPVSYLVYDTNTHSPTNASQIFGSMFMGNLCASRAS